MARVSCPHCGQGLPRERKASKYGNVPTEVDGVVFASKREAARYTQLKQMERAGLISQLTLQPPFDIIVSGVKICRYVGDFRYVEAGVVVIEDAKGMRTPAYKIKRKLMRAVLGIDVKEV